MATPEILKSVWRDGSTIAKIVAGYVESIGMLLAAIGAWAAAIKYMTPILRDFNGFLGDVLLFCLAAGPLIWAVRRLHRMISSADAEDEDETVGEPE